MKYKISKIQLRKIKFLCDEFSIRKIELFGSVIRNDFNSKSDIDILIELEKEHDLSYYDFYQIREQFEIIFDRKIDLILKNGLSKKFIEEFIKETFIICI